LNTEILKDPTVRETIESMTALGGIGKVSGIANVAAFLASDEGGWVTGQYIEASGGFRPVLSTQSPNPVITALEERIRND